MRLNSVHVLTETEHVVRVSDELAGGGQVRIVAHVENTVGLRVDVNFTEVEGFGAKLNIVTLRLALRLES
jgi:hypothetical protein